MDSSHTSCAEKYFGIVLKSESSPKSRFQALYSLTSISSSHSLQTQFAVPLNMFVLKAHSKLSNFMRTKRRCLIWRNPQSSHAQMLYEFRSAGPGLSSSLKVLCAHSSCWGISISFCTCIFNIWLNLPVLHSWIYDSLRTRYLSLLHYSTVFLLYCGKESYLSH